MKRENVSMKVVFMGTPEFAVYSLDAIHERNDEIALVISQEDKARDRGKKVQHTPVKARALELGIDIFQPKSIKSDEAFEKIKEINPDIIIVTAYGQIIPKRILDIPKLGAVNVHASLLPKYRGAAPIHYCLIDGEKKTGITTMFMSEGLDTGDMILKDEIDIDDNDDLKSLHDKLAILSKKTLKNTLDLFEKGDIVREKQDDSLSSYAPTVKKELGHINYENSATDIVNLSRALSTFSILDGESVKLFNIKVGEITKCNDFGKLINISNDYLEIVAKDNTVKIFEIQFPGKKRISVKDFLKGNSLTIGTIFN